jgi:hypothetical protein
MKIREILGEGIRDEFDIDGHDDDDEMSRADGDDFGTFGDDERDDDWTEDDIGFGDHEEEMEMNLSSNADTKMINAVKKVCDQYKGQGHAQVELLPFLTKVIEIAKKPVNLADLIAINKKSRDIQSMIDSIDEKKVKFKNMSVKNEDPNKAKEEKSTTVDAMAGRAATRNRGL